MIKYQRTNNIIGWVVFGIATLVYLLTVEETASFWDSGEFIAVSYKLEVPHPPGAPFFLLLGRMFSFFASDVTQVAYWINLVSVLSSGFTILFLFWTITLLGRKIFKITDHNETPGQIAALMSAGVVGALAFTFTDSFWFSAVEAEVYALSSFFTAFVFWAILKWELIESEQQRNRWLILIAYMVGLSIGVHLLNLVTLPALGLIYYFRDNKPTKWGIVATMAISGLILLIIMVGIIPGLPSMAGGFEIFFVNTLGLPFGSGVIFLLVVLVGSITYGIFYSIKKKKVLLNTIMLCLTFVLIGYSTYTLVLIRSNYNPPIDENNPENLLNYVSYLKREQYGDRPLLKGPYYTAELTKQEKGDPVYMRGKDKYVVKDYKIENTWDPKNSTILPRIYSSDGRHKQAYEQILGLRPGEKPTFSDNIKFMFIHQLGHMYLRYFMWNFVGRESDIQNASWLMPWSSTEGLPDILATNRARNNYFMLPLILGLIGLIFVYIKDQRTFWVLALLFFLTGAALVLYLNSPPIEPRERDYIYVGSYYVFAIWIGFGVFAISEGLEKLIKSTTVRPMVAGALGLLVPIILAAQNWDDHDRSHRYFSVDTAKNLLESLAPNAIIFTGGDNDTFPLWYVQEVEGFRTDVRVIVLSYFNTDWYIDQMTRQAYKSDPLPFSLGEDQYRQGGLNDYLPLIENQNVKDGKLDLNQYLGLIKRNYEGIQIPTSFSKYNTVPAKTFTMKVDTAAVLAKGLIPDDKREYLVDKMEWSLNSNKLYKNDLMVLDLIANANWDRPIYFNNTSIRSLNFDISDYTIQEGEAYRLLPIKKPSANANFVNVDVMYENIMTKYSWRGVNDPDVYLNDDYRGFVQNHRYSMNALAEALLLQDDKERALKVLDKSLEVMPDETVELEMPGLEMITLYIQAGETDKAQVLAQKLGDRAVRWLTYMDENNRQIGDQFRRNMIILNQLSSITRNIGDEELAKKYNDVFQQYLNSPNLK